MPKVLSDEDVADFRERLCRVAEGIFVENGPNGVTMRQLASALGVSPMTPYRYFKDKDDILAAVRTNGFNRFAEKLETAFAEGGRDATERSRAVVRAYREFAFEHPNTYRLMFDLDQPNADNYPALVDARIRARATMTQHVEALIAEDVLHGDPARLGMMFWSSTHGAVVLELAGKLPPGTAEDLVERLRVALMRGLQPEG